MSTPRSALRAELTMQLVPALRALGFTGPDAIAGNALLHEFRRPASAGTHVVTLQLEKRGLPRFVVMLAVEPPEGFAQVTARGGSVVQGQLRPAAGASSRHWFRCDASFVDRLLRRRGPSAADVVAHCVALLPEVEAWWETRRASAHISVITHRFPGRR